MRDYFLWFLEAYVSNLAPLSGLPNQHGPSVVSAGKLELWPVRVSVGGG